MAFILDISRPLDSFAVLHDWPGPSSEVGDYGLLEENLRIPLLTRGIRAGFASDPLDGGIVFGMFLLLFPLSSQYHFLWTPGMGALFIFLPMFL